MPLVPFVEFEESATGEFHGFGGVIENLTGGQNVELTESSMALLDKVGGMLHGQFGAIV